MELGRKEVKWCFFYKCICIYFECLFKFLVRFLFFSLVWLVIIFKIIEFIIFVFRIKYVIVISFFVYLLLNNDFFVLKDEMLYRFIKR